MRAVVYDRGIEQEMKMTTASTLSALMAAPKTHKVVTAYADGRVREHLTASMAQAENFAIGERRKVGLKLISRETGKEVTVVSVSIVAL